MADAVDAQMDTNEAPFVEPFLDLIARDAGRQQLHPRHDAMLAPRDPGDDSRPRFTPRGRPLPCVRGLPPAFRMPSRGLARRPWQALPAGPLRRGAALRSALALGGGTRPLRRQPPA